MSPTTTGGMLMSVFIIFTTTDFAGKRLSAINTPSGIPATAARLSALNVTPRESPITE